MSGVRYRLIRLEDAEAAVELEDLCYPALGEKDRLSLSDVDDQATTFPEGSWVATVNGRLVGMSLTWRVHFDPARPEHRLIDVGDGSAHSPEGPWLYGLDTSVHPDFRGEGIAGHFYELRRQYVVEHSMEGIVAGGMLPGYASQADQLSVREYVDAVVAKRLRDPTLSFQLSQGFTVEGLLPNYVDSTVADGTATLLVWRPASEAGP